MTPTRRRRLAWVSLVPPSLFATCLMLPIVPTLMTKWKRMLLGFPRSKESFEALSASTDEEVLEAWQKEYDDAMEARQNDPKIMDTFDVSSGRVIDVNASPGKDLTQLRLAGEESAKGLEKGTAGWLSTGLKIQEAQLKLANDIRKAGQNPSVAEDLKTLERRQRLEVSILTFQRRSEKFMGRLEDVPAMEDRDDASHGAWTEVLPYRKRVHPANSVGTMTRAQAEVHAADQTVLACTRLYSTNRRAIMRLGTTDEDLALYRPLDKKDLHVKTAIIEASTSGLRNVNLAWFWTVDVLEIEVHQNGWTSVRHCPD
ncbi:hypothetical protein BKA93DRAFT_754265 [Sparassis latifolia]